jgi:branched-chain amino acid transport system substrate-binding protein
VPRAVQAANKLINRDGIFAMIGGLGTAMNNAVLPLQLKENIPNLFPTGQARAMWEPFHQLKFAATSSYYDQIRSGLKFVITQSKATSVCALTQNTDFGKEFVEGITDEAQADGVKLTKSLTYKPRDTDFTTQILELKEANCGVIALGSLARDTILIYTAARQNGIDVPIVGGSSSYDPTIAAAPGMSGLYAAVPTIVPDPEKATPAAKAEMDKFKSRFGIDLNATAINALVAMDLTTVALERAGPDLTIDKFVRALESIKNYSTIWDTPVQNYGPDVHQGSRDSFLCEVKAGKYEKITGPIGYAGEK